MLVSSSPDSATHLRLRDGVALLAVVGVILAGGLAFVLPWLPPPPPSAPLDHYAPVRDGANWLTVTTGPDDQARSWTSSSQEIVPATRVFATSLRSAQVRAVRQFYGTAGDAAAPASIDDAMAQLEATGALVVRTSERELGVTGIITDSTSISLRTAAGEFLLGFYQPARDQDLMFEPALPVLSGTLTLGDEWQARGTLNQQVDYTFTSKVLAVEAYSGPAGMFNDCVWLESRLVLMRSGATLDDILHRNWQCAGVGSVVSERLAADGSLLTRTTLVAANLASGSVADARALPAAAPRTLAAPAALGQPARWNVTRWSRLVSTSDSAGSSSFAPVWLPTEPPLVLAAASDGALTALDARDPTGVVRWRFAIGGTFFGQPAYDSSSGRIFVGASDKRLYALDARGLYLWSFQADDNIATRPVVAGGVVVFGSEDRTIYGVDASTGRLAWDQPIATSGPVVSSPAVAGNVLLIGSDDGQVYGLDPATGNERWPAFTAEDAIEAPIVVSNGTAYVASRDGNLYGLDPATGEQIWHGLAGNALRTAPAVSNERIFVVDELGYLKALDLASGRRLWVSADSDYAGPPVLVTLQDGSQAIVATHETGTIALLDLDGRQRQQWSIAPLAGPSEDAPALDYAATAGGDALWIADDNAVLYRLGLPLPGPASLKLAWYHAASETPFAGLDGSGLYSTSADYRGQAVMLDQGGNIYIVNPADSGARRIGRYGPSDGLLAYLADPVVAEDTLLIASAGSLGAVDLRDGRTLWTFAAAQGMTSLRPVALAGSTVLWLAGVPQGQGELYALDLHSGALQWQATLDNLALAGGVVVHGERVYTSSPPLALDLATGKVLWRATLDGLALGGPALSATGDTLFVGTLGDTKNVIYALDTANGNVRWQTDLDSVIAFSEQPWLSGNTLIIPGYDGQLVALDAADGALRWHLPAERRWGAVTVDAGRIWQIDPRGHITVRSVADGALLQYYSALDLNLEINGLAAGRPARIGSRMILPLSSAVIAFEVP